MSEIKKDLSFLTDEAINDLLVSVDPTNVRAAVRDNFEVWTRKLFPILIARKIPVYAYLADLLGKGGYKTTPKLLAFYFWEIRKEMKLPSTPSKPPSFSQADLDELDAVLGNEKSPLTEQQHAVGGSAPAGNSSPITVQKTPSVSPVFVVKEGHIPPEPYDDVMIEVQRLRNEVKLGNYNWTGVDEGLWNEIWEMWPELAGQHPDSIQVELTKDDPAAWSKIYKSLRKKLEENGLSVRSY